MRPQVPRMDISSEGQGNWIWYYILFPGSDWGAGNARVEFNPLGHYRLERPRIYGRLVEESLQPEATIAEITYFYPHYNYETTDRYMRLGIGSRVLGKVVEDSRERGAKAIYCFGPSRSMKGFLVNKHGFGLCDPTLGLDREHEFYKMLKEATQGTGL